MDKIKVAFFGTSDRSIPILEALTNCENVELALCITKTDTKVGRKQEIRETEVKKWAKKNQIMVTTVSNLKGMELEAIIEQLKSSNITFGVVADFSFIIPYPLIEYFNEKIINIHFSLLPKYRGASPVQFALLNGDETTGITYMLADKRLDSGKIIHQIGYKISNNETSGELYKILFELAAENLCFVIDQYSKDLLKTRKQNEDEASYTYSPSHPKNTFIYKEDAHINWKNDVTTVERAIRAYNPWPVAWTTVGEILNNKKLQPNKLNLISPLDNNIKVKIFGAKIVDQEKLQITDLQIEGRKRMDWKTFENGYLAKE